MVLNKIRTPPSLPSADSEMRKLILEDLTETEVRKVMKDKGMKYKKIVHIAMSANSE